MPLNLITDAWIPVIRHGNPVKIRPHEIAVDGVERLNWPREDLNLACMELLIGLTFLADPPDSDGDWHERYTKPDPERLGIAFETFSPYFELDGDGPRFLQDFDPFENQAKKNEVQPPDMLFIDSAAKNTVRNNSDLMVKRNRHTSLDLPLAAISLYTLQAFAPAGGAGVRTSIRGGGPLVTLIKPLDVGTCPLWRFVWCNVSEPEGQRLDAKSVEFALPWLRPTRTSDKNQIVTQEMSHLVEAFFGMPRRIRLIFAGDSVTGVVQRPYGTNYEHWLHPLSPYYSKEVGGQKFPVHPSPGKLSYRNWLGLAFGIDNDKRFKARMVSRYHNLVDAPRAEVFVGGWAMSNMKPRDFSLDCYPTFHLDTEMDMRVSQLVEAANSVVNKLSSSLNKAMSFKGAAANSVRESFFFDTEIQFVNAVQDITSGNGADVELNWIKRLHQKALVMFDQYSLSTLSDRNVSEIEKTVNARQDLQFFFIGKRGIRKMFPEVFDAG